jgi:hypothetical protein
MYNGADELPKWDGKPAVIHTVSIGDVVAKCKHCKSCLRIVRTVISDIESDKVNIVLVWYCSLCDKMYEFKDSHKEIVDAELKLLVKHEYKLLYGDTVN